MSHPLNKDQKFESLKRWLCWQLGSRLVPGPVVIPFVEDSKLLVRPGMTGATGNIYTGLHEFEEMAFVLHFLRPEDLFVDVGANVGTYTILASAVAGARSLCFEPIPETFRHLLQNIRLNHITHLVRAQNRGISNGVGTLKFTSLLDTMNHVLTENEEAAGIHPLQIPADSLDNICAGQNPSLLKIDVEGYESHVIRGAAKLLTRLEALIVELNENEKNYGQEIKQTHEKVMDLGFKAYRYAPFERRLRPQDQLVGGNKIYIRNLRKAEERTSSAKTFSVLGNKI